MKLGNLLMEGLMFEKDPLSPSVPFKETKTTELTPLVTSSLSPPSASSISKLQYGLSKRIPFNQSRPPVNEEEVLSEGEEDSYQILRQKKIQKESCSAPSSPPVSLFRQLSLPSLSGTKPTANLNFFDKEKWKTKDVDRLLDPLNHQEGFPWDTIKTISHPILIEQLIDLSLLCEMKRQQLNSKLEPTEILEFALNLANIAISSPFIKEYTHSIDLIEKTKEMLGQLIYLVDCDLEHVLTIFHSDGKDKWESLQELFDLHFQNIIQHLYQEFTICQNSHLQSADLMFSIHLPLEIAKLLLTTKGTVNVGLINLIQQHFIPSLYPINHQINLSYGLKSLKQSFELRKEVEWIQKPHSPHMPSNEVIRAILNLPAEEIVTSLHAKQVIVSAFLSHLRQDETGSCFATSLAIELLSSHLHHCLKDLVQLLEESKLTRTLKEVSRDIPFIKSIYDADLSQTLMIDENGHLITMESSKIFIWETPGLQAAATSIGIHDLKKALTNLLLLKDPPLIHQKLECQEILKKLCLYQIETDPSLKKKLGSLFAQACFAFSAQTHQALLKIWENSIANMAEVKEQGMIKTYILDAILHAIQLKLGELHIPPSLFVKEFLQDLKKTIYQFIQLQYDPTLKSLPDKHAYPNKRQGGFVLYVNNQRIDQASIFIKFLQDLILHACNKWKNKLLKPDEEKFINLMQGQLFLHLSSEDFLTRLLIKYHPANAALLVQSNQFDKLRFTPWITLKGNKSKAVLQVYLETDQPIPTEKFNQKSLEERLLSIIKLGKSLNEPDKQAFLNNTHKSNLLRIPGWHTSRLILLGHPSLGIVLEGQQTAEEWLDGIKKSGLQIAESIIDEETRCHFFKAIEEKLLPQLISSKADQIKILLSQIPSELSIKQTRETFVQLLQEQEEIDTNALPQIKRQIDTLLYESLNPVLNKQFKNSIFPIIDTNWNEECHDLYLYAVVNPGTGQFEIWQAYSNESRMQAISQKEWIQEWEIFFIPDEVLKNDPNH